MKHQAKEDKYIPDRGKSVRKMNERTRNSEVV